MISHRDEHYVDRWYPSDARDEHDVEDQFQRYLDEKSKDGWEFVNSVELDVPSGSVTSGTGERYIQYQKKTFFVFKKVLDILS